MKGVLSSNIDHYKYTAQALQEKGILSEYISCAFFKYKPWYYNKIKSLNKWIDNRIEKKLNYKITTPFIYQEIVYKFIRNSKISKYIDKGKIDRYFNSIFDKRVKRRLSKYKELDFFHYVSGIGYESALLAKDKFNCKIIVDDRAEHKQFLYRILQEEYKKLGLEFNDKNFWNVDCRRDYEVADYIITPSNFSKQTFVDQGIDPKKLVVIPYGCETKLFYPTTRKYDGKFRVIYVGNVCVRKGAHYLLEAFNEITNPDIELLIIGKVEKELEEMMANVKNNVKHIKYVPNNKLNKYYGQSDVFILPSLSDSFSLATLEAMSAGVPVIVSENVGAKDFVNDGENGYIIPIRDSVSIKNKIEYLYNNKDKCKEMGNEAYDTIKENSWDYYKVRINEFYDNKIL